MTSKTICACEKAYIIYSLDAIKLINIYLYENYEN